jgi:hypothetical protein
MPRSLLLLLLLWACERCRTTRKIIVDEPAIDKNQGLALEFGEIRFKGGHCWL